MCLYNLLGTKKTRVVKREVPKDSFFRFFEPPKMPQRHEHAEGEEHDHDEEDEEVRAVTIFLDDLNLFKSNARPCAAVRSSV